VSLASVGSQHSGALRLIALMVPGFALVGLISELLKGLGRAWIGLFLQNTCVPLLAVPTVLMTGSRSAEVVSAVLLASVSATGLLSMVAWSLATKDPSANPGSRSRVTSLGAMRNLLTDTPNLLAVTATPVVMHWAGAALLGFLTSPAQVAGYSVAARLAIAVSVVHSAASSVVAPRMAVAHGQRDMSQLHRLTMRTGLLIALLTWPVLLTLALAAPFILGVFGGEFRSFANVLVILIAGQAVASLIGHSGTVLVMTGQYVSARVTSAIAAGSLAILLLALTPAYGAVGAALAMTGSVVTGHLAGLLLVNRDDGFWTIPTRFSDINKVLR
jgi:O-antigen/teichoic acid export membrane protein